jgi:3-oxoacyl-[acyl-carrier protein] reductase
MALTHQPEARENRSIVNVSSTSGLHGNVGQANYAAAKAAVIGLTKTIAKEWGPYGVRANTIAFGLIHTRYALPSPRLLFSVLLFY